MSDSGFLNEDLEFESIERLETKGSTSEAFTVKIKGKIYFMKRLRAEFTGDPKYRTLFRKEYEIGSSLSTPYIPEYIRLGDEEGNAYILMEYILGDNIEEKLTSDPQYFHNSKNIERLLIQLLEGLALLHKRDIIHLDIKPENIMLTRFGDNVKITDLGFCANAAYHRTAGYTAGFQAPEVEEKRWDAIDAQSDIYSVGMLLRYIKECSDAKFTRKLHSFMQRCLCKEKKRRFANCDEAIHFLEKSSKGRSGVVAAISTITIVVAAILLLPGKATEKSTPKSIKTGGVEYHVLSHEELTCSAVGGEGWEGNMYIEPKIKIGDKVYSTVAIADSAFSHSDIKSIHIPEGVETVGKGALYKCHSIVTVNLPNTIKEFSGAFPCMKNLHRIKIPVIKDVCATAFVDAGELTEIHFPEGVERICIDAFVSCKKLKRIGLPQSLKVIERGVFYDCKALEEITIPAGVLEIGDYAFYECDSLHSVYCHAMTPPRITAIFNTTDVTVYVPKAALDAYKKDFYWSGYNLKSM